VFKFEWSVELFGAEHMNGQQQKEQEVVDERPHVDIGTEAILFEVRETLREFVVEDLLVLAQNGLVLHIGHIGEGNSWVLLLFDRQGLLLNCIQSAVSPREEASNLALGPIAVPLGAQPHGEAIIQDS
ncbi:hypothetical protein Ciccas_013575, partial [Cichlidogyrus casuarinus]